MTERGADTSSSAHARRIEPLAELFREGEAGDTAYIVESGRLEISLLREGRKVVVAELGPGSLVGEMALIGAGTRSATATALEETHVAYTLLGDGEGVQWGV